MQTLARVYEESEVNVVGRVFQFIRDWETGERWELIVGLCCPEQLIQLGRTPLHIVG
jgi:hypothetical protein